MTTTALIVAIDGPSGVGKSSTSKLGTTSSQRAVPLNAPLPKSNVAVNRPLLIGTGSTVTTLPTMLPPEIP